MHQIDSRIIQKAYLKILQNLLHGHTHEAKETLLHIPQVQYHFFDKTV